MQRTNQAGMASGVGTCADVLHADTLLFLRGGGTTASTCFWSDGHTLVANLNTRTALQPDMSVRVRDGVLAPHGHSCPGSDACATGLVRALSTTSQGGALVCPVPTALLAGPTAISDCSDATIVLDGSASTPAGIVLPTYEWSVVTANTTNAVELAAVLAALPADNSVVTLGASLLGHCSGGAERYVFALRVRSFLDKLSDAAKLEVVRSGRGPSSMVAIEGPMVRAVRPSEALGLAAYATLASCWQKSAAVDFWWAFSPALPSIGAQTSARLTLPAGARPDASAESTVTITVCYESLVARIGGGDRSVQANAPLHLDASSSADPSALPPAESMALGFAWAQKPAGWLAVGEYLASVAVLSANGRRAHASMCLNAVSAPVPRVTLAPLPGKPSADDRLVLRALAVTIDDANAAIAALVAVGLATSANDALARNVQASELPWAYAWMVFSDSTTQAQLDLSDPAVSSTGPGRANLVLLRGAMVAVATYIFELSVSASAASVGAAVVRLRVLLNRPPFGGELTYAPSSGVAAVTAFADMPLQFSYAYALPAAGAEERALLGELRLGSTAKVFLPAGSWRLLSASLCAVASSTLDEPTLRSIMEQIDVAAAVGKSDEVHQLGARARMLKQLLEAQAGAQPSPYSVRLWAESVAAVLATPRQLGERAQLHGAARDGVPIGDESRARCDGLVSRAARSLALGLLKETVEASLVASSATVSVLALRAASSDLEGESLRMPGSSASSLQLGSAAAAAGGEGGLDVHIIVVFHHDGLREAAHDLGGVDVLIALPFVRAAATAGPVGASGTCAEYGGCRGRGACVGGGCLCEAPWLGADCSLRAECAYWDELGFEWATDGCTTVYSADEAVAAGVSPSAAVSLGNGTVGCAFTHLTNFAAVYLPTSAKDLKTEATSPCSPELADNPWIYGLVFGLVGLDLLGLLVAHAYDRRARLRELVRTSSVEPEEATLRSEKQRKDASAVQPRPGRFSSTAAEPMTTAAARFARVNVESNASGTHPSLPSAGGTGQTAFIRQPPSLHAAQISSCVERTLKSARTAASHASTRVERLAERVERVADGVEARLDQLDAAARDDGSSSDERERMQVKHGTVDFNASQLAPSPPPSPPAGERRRWQPEPPPSEDEPPTLRVRGISWPSVRSQATPVASPSKFKCKKSSSLSDTRASGATVRSEASSLSKSRASGASMRSDASLRATELDVENLRALLVELDVDSSGALDMAELAVLLDRLGEEVPPRAAAAIFRRLDRDGDGKASLDEIEQWFRKRKRAESTRLRRAELWRRCSLSRHSKQLLAWLAMLGLYANFLVLILAYGLQFGDAKVARLVQSWGIGLSQTFALDEPIMILIAELIPAAIDATSKNEFCGEIVNEVINSFLARSGRYFPDNKVDQYLFEASALRRARLGLGN
ncbi:hypothetical protein T492DRAFT_834293 [Pavlovales sp. CCMP2436]|nr:hypothetical protein T492DRAFT_834293 [Pavlovales sp. CCMP2436]